VYKGVKVERSFIAIIIIIIIINIITTIIIETVF